MVRGQVGLQAPPATSSTSALIQRSPCCPAQGMRLVCNRGQGRWPLNRGLLGVSRSSTLGEKRQLGSLWLHSFWRHLFCPPGTGWNSTIPPEPGRGQNRRHLHQTAGAAEVPGAGAAQLGGIWPWIWDEESGGWGSGGRVSRRDAVSSPRSMVQQH